MFSAKDFEIESIPEFLLFLPIFIFCGLVTPFLIAAYSLGAVSDVIGWLD